MTQDLPAGLVTTTGKIGSELDGLGDVAVEDIAKLWRVYTTHSSVQRDGAAARLENLFWRIWGSSRLRQTLTGSTLAALFMDISQDRPLRTTPRQSLQAALKKTSLISDPLNPSVSNYSDTENVPSAYSIQTRTPLPSILKKPNAEKPSATPGEPSSFKTTRIVVPDAAVHKAKATLTLATAATAVTSRDHPPQKAGRKKPMFVASTSALSKRRPVVIRRKSAQTSPSAEVSEDSLFKPEPAPATTKADGPAQKPAISEEQDNAAQGLSWQSLSYLRPDGGNNNNNTSNQTTTSSSPAPTTTTTTTRLSPPPIGFTTSSVHRHASPIRPPPSTEQAASSSSMSTTTLSLVDPDFRSRFTERRKRQEAAGGDPSSRNSPATNSPNSSSQSYLGSLIATSAAAARRGGGSRSLSPGPKTTTKTTKTRHLIMPPAPTSSENITDPKYHHPTRPRSRRSSSSSLSSLSLSSLRSGEQPQQQQQNNMQGQGQGQTSIQTAIASGEFSLPKPRKKDRNSSNNSSSSNSSHHLSSIIEREEEKRRRRERLQKME